MTLARFSSFLAFVSVFPYCAPDDISLVEVSTPPRAQPDTVRTDTIAVDTVAVDSTVADTLPRAATPRTTLLERLAVAERHALLLAADLRAEAGRLPRSVDAGGTRRRDVGYADWTSGFFPGTLWYLYGVTADETLLSYAESYTQRVREAQHLRGTHDLGFMVYNSFGKGVEIGPDDATRRGYRAVVNTAARTLAERYNPTVGALRSWDFNRNRWQYPVIIDNMMNLELLVAAAEDTGEERLREIAIAHADRTLEDHFRLDNSVYHVVSYDPRTGDVELKDTWQGLSTESSWARGQAWGLHGYSSMYRLTGLPRYRLAAVALADYILDHANLPADFIPYWDFDAPGTERTPRDASAAAIMAAAFVELSQLPGDIPARERYLCAAENQVATLSGPDYLAPVGTNEGLILRNSVGAFPQNSEIGHGLIYADYYYVEALTRLLAISDQ